MANTIATCWGYDRARVKEDHRLGSERAEAEASTWHTFARVRVDSDGSGWVRVMRNGKVIHGFAFGPENGPDPTTLAVT